MNCQGNKLTEYLEGGCDAKMRIMRAALEEFSVRSIDGARTREIAKKAEVNHAAISYYFGGKEGLYHELVREIASFIMEFTKPYFEGAKKIAKENDSAAAKKLLLDFYMSRIPQETSDRKFLGNISMLISREEIYPTKAFDIFYKTFKEINCMAESMITVASKGKISGIDAKLTSGMLMLQVKIFKSYNTGVMKNNGWKEIGKKEIAQIEKFLKSTLNNILR